MKKLKPYSDNIVFLDTEFSTNEPKTAELLSIGLVKVDGNELYLELEHSGEVSKWVKENVTPFLTNEKASKSVAIGKIKEFIGDQEPYPVCFVNIYDMVYLYSFFGSINKAPFHWPPIDFASMLFASGIDPESYYRGDKNNFFDKIGIDASSYDEHNALDDAKLLREIYLKIVI